LAASRTVADAMADAWANPPSPFPTENWPARKRQQTVQITPGEPAYSEVRKLDPQATSIAEAEITPGHWVALTDSVSRLTAPNAGMMTGPGTNTYLIQTGTECVLIDPGPDDPSHIDALLAATEGRLRHILVTHTHPDHSPGACVLKQATGATLIGMPPPGDGMQDTSFQPDHVPVDGEILKVGSLNLRVIHTPGHASNHLCYLLEADSLLFSGDHIMQGSTVVINPPDGDMAAYLDSLNRLLEMNIQWIGPGHGFLMGYPRVVVDYLVTHRLTRERKVIDALKQHGPGTLKELTPYAYADVPSAIHGLAARSLLAHLLKLEQGGLASCGNETWGWIGEE
jgi:glyoxylase-like metal-dependent hydrolase (beta-lactamase superfamily II)